MPPPLEDAEEFEQQVAYESDFDEVVNPDTPIAANKPKSELSSDSSLEAQRELQYEPQQKLREVSPVPLVVSDIVRRAATVKRTALPAHKPATTELKERPQKMDKKRARDPGTLDQGGPLAKKKTSTRRENPCIYCVRRLANDPKWVCREALVSQQGIRNYKGLRCGSCVAAHASCRSIPDKAVEPVRTLCKTAADVVASNGTNKIQVLAAYEAAIGPALKAMIVIPDPHAPGPQKRQRQPSKSKQQSFNGTSPWPANPAPSLPSAGTSTCQQQQQQSAQADNVTPSAPSPLLQQQYYHHHQRHQDAAELERLERLALRRRKVEALESISHTAALLLAEFMTFAKRQGSSPSSAGAANDGQSTGAGSLSGRNPGMVYAAAAAGMAASMLRHSGSVEEHDQPYSNRTSTDAHFDAVNDGDSDSESSNASTIADNHRETVTTVQAPLEQGEDDVEMLSGPEFDENGVYDGGVIGKKAEDDEGNTDPGSEVKVEE